MPAKQRVPQRLITATVACATKDDAIVFLCGTDVGLLERELLLRVWCKEHHASILRSDVERLKSPWLQAAQRPLFE